MHQRIFNRDIDLTRNHRYSVYGCLVWGFIILSPFQNTVFQNTPLKMAGASLSFFPLMALFLLASIRHFWLAPFEIKRFTLAAVAYATIVCAVNLVWIYQDEIIIYWKSLRGYPLLTVLIFFVVFGIKYWPSRGLRIAIYMAFIFSLIGILCDRLLGSNAIPVLQTTLISDGRPRGFSTEASTLSVQIVASGMLTAHFLARSWQKWSVGGLTVALLVYSASKGALISLLVCIIVLGIAKSRSSLFSKVVIGCVLLPVAYFGSLSILSIFGTLVEANETATIGTRLSMTVYALITVAHNPFGVGFTGFLPSIPLYLPQAMRFIDSIFPFPVGFAEAKEYLYPPQDNADCKSFFLDYFVFFGVPFAIVFCRFVAKIFNQLFKLRYYWLFVGALFSVIALMTYYSEINAWTIPLLFGISLHEIRRAESSLRL